MDWEVLIAPLGIALLVFLSWALGGGKRARLDDEDTALIRFAQDYPSLTANRVVRSTDGHAALLSLSDGTVGIVFTTGDRFATRLWKPGALTRLERRGAQVVLGTTDIALRKLNLTLPEGTDGDDWQRKLEALIVTREQKA